MDLIFTAFELVCISLGAGAAFMFDSFFLLSPRRHKIKPLELRVLRRLSLLSITGSLGTVIFYGLLISNSFQTATDMRISIYASKLIILAVAFVAGLAIRKVHIKALMRHQTEYSHLSEEMSVHPDPLVSTAAYSTISWMFIIFLTALEYRQAYSVFHFGFLSIMVSYIVLGFLVSKMAIYIKRKLV